MSIQEVWVKEEPECVEPGRVKQEPADGYKNEVSSELCRKRKITIELEPEPQQLATGFVSVKLEPFDPIIGECDPVNEPKKAAPTLARSYKREKPRQMKRNFTVPRFTTYICDYCGNRFPYKSYLVRHIQVHLDKKFYSCSICQKQFTSKFNYKEHGRLHTGQKPFVCELCNRRFSLKSYLVRHQLIHKDDRIYACNLCDKRFTVKSYLITHRRIHTGEKSHTCNVCNKQFAVKSYLITHMVTHARDKVYSCEVCQKQFGHKSNLNLHKRSHTGDKPFSCNVCEKKFARKCQLSDHKMIHSSKKPFSCSVCKKQFTLKCNMTSHFRIHTGEKRFSCEVCKKRFTFKSNLKSHYRYYPGDHRNPDEPHEKLSERSGKDSSKEVESTLNEESLEHTSIKHSPKSPDHSISVKVEPVHPSEDLSLYSQVPIKQTPDESIPLDLSSVDSLKPPPQTRSARKDVQSGHTP